MYLHLSREISIPAGDIVAIINLNIPWIER